MTNTTGPARLRQIAEFTILSAAELRQLAAQWEADRRELSNVNADREKIWKALQDNESALERARALLVKLRDGIDDYWGFCNPEIIADLAALLAAASGGAA